MNFVVTAGGHGSKMWPFSRHRKPKQFQKIVDSKSLLTRNIETLLQGYSADKIFISTKERYVPLVREHAPGIPVENYIVEPDITNGRGPAEGLAFLTLARKRPGETYMTVQSDC